MRLFFPLAACVSVYLDLFSQLVGCSIMASLESANISRTHTVDPGERAFRLSKRISRTISTRWGRLFESCHNNLFCFQRHVYARAIIPFRHAEEERRGWGQDRQSVRRAAEKGKKNTWNAEWKNIKKKGREEGFYDYSLLGERISTEEIWMTVHTRQLYRHHILFIYIFIGAIKTSLFVYVVELYTDNEKA